MATRTIQSTVGEPILRVNGIRQAFPRGDGEPLLVLDDVTFQLCKGEIVGLLGRSGSGKSTLLRLIAGLNRPTGGEIAYHGRPLAGPAQGIAMVFQSFALFPWLTVLENVELGLEAMGTPEREMRKRALAAIDLIGLDGYESAYPKELSGGMRQRVGFARATVVHPDILLMDEPFSALDILTAETLRTDFLDLWCEGQMPIKSVLLVTHNIEEAVLMCDRVLVFASLRGEPLSKDLAQESLRDVLRTDELPVSPSEIVKCRRPLRTEAGGAPRQDETRTDRLSPAGRHVRPQGDDETLSSLDVRNIVV